MKPAAFPVFQIHLTSSLKLSPDLANDASNLVDAKDDALAGTGKEAIHPHLIVNRVCGEDRLRVDRNTGGKEGALGVESVGRGRVGQIASVLRRNLLGAGM
jgi:hypothetical protein